jgi:hypothetical protein
VDYAEAVQYQKDGIPQVAMEKFAGFVRSHPDDKRVPQALARHLIAAKAANVTEGLSRYYRYQSERAVKPYVKQHAHFLSLEALLQENKPAEALRGFEVIISKPPTYRDSVMAVIGAMRIHMKYGDHYDLPTRYPENIMPSHRAMAERMMELSASIHRRSRDNTDESLNDALVPTEYKLYQNYPNPFNPATEIRYDLSEAVQVQLKIFNVLGQHVVTLVDQVANAGAFRVYWDGKNANGIDVATGMYIYQLKAGNFNDAKKMVMLR